MSRLEIKDFEPEHLIGVHFIDDAMARKAVAVERNMKLGGYAWSAFLGDKCLGCGGLYLEPDGKYLAWVDTTPELLKYPVAFHKAALKIFAHAKAAVGKGKITAIIDMESPKNLKWARRFGFKPTPVVMMEAA